MVNKLFKITLNSDCIVKSISATEGVPKSLSYIPGSLILGIAAIHYKEFQNPFDIFHSGKVKFGNAFIAIKDKPSLRVPFCWHYPKDEEISKKIVSAHLTDNYDELEKLLNGKQPKQMRGEFVDLKFENIYTPNYNFQLKSAYDRKFGRSKDSSMFAYETLKKGTEYIFEIKFDSDIEDSDIALVEKVLIGKHFIGKSKTAQFGNINISSYNLRIEDKSFNAISDSILAKSDDAVNKEGDNVGGLVFLYAGSDIALNGEAGFDTVDVNSTSLFGINSGRILQRKTYLDYRKFSMFNCIIGRRLPIRTVISAGSIICIEGVEKTEREYLLSKKVIFTGNYLNEGFGEVYINPPFLLKKEYDGLNKVDERSVSKLGGCKAVSVFNGELAKEIDYNGEILLGIMKSKISKRNIINESLNLAENIFDKHKNKFKRISKSQWGALRAIATKCGKNKGVIIEKIDEYTEHGVAHDTWEDGGAREALLESLGQHKNDERYDLAVTIKYLTKLVSL